MPVDEEPLFLGVLLAKPDTAERGLTMARITIMRRVLKFTPSIEQRWRKYARPVGKSWRVDENRAPGSVEDLRATVLVA